jgi:3',5'-cyclic AMP phosphodiesterase CpdA
MSQPTVLFHVSDLHFGDEDRAALDWFAQAVASEAPAGVICTGDLTMRGSAREFAAAADWLGRLAAPVSVELGNHDVPYYYHPLRRLFTPYAHYRALREAVHSEIVSGDVAIVPLKTVARAQLRLNWSKGRVSKADLSATLAGLTRHAGKPLRLVACHHPLVEAGTHSTGSTRGGRQALAALAAAGADAVLSGHVHDAFDRIEDSPSGPIRIIGAGTLSQRLRRTRPSYNRLEWRDGKLSVNLCELA